LSFLRAGGRRGCRPIRQADDRRPVSSDDLLSSLSDELIPAQEAGAATRTLGSTLASGVRSLA